jgi:proteasome lid subunit RPN8/RPN11
MEGMMRLPLKMIMMRRSKIGGIARSTMMFILEASKSSHPKEFAGLLREEEGIIKEVLLVPGTHSSGRGALMDLYNIPLGLSVVGTVHSHPSGNFTPSNADLHLFRRKGFIHIITGYPYSKDSWGAYDSRGEKVDIQVVEIEFDYGDEEEW